MDEKRDHNHQSSNGFLMGVIVGAAATLLFTTKKGREIVKDLSDKGFEKLSEWEETIEKQESIEDVENDYIEPVEIEKLKLAKEAVSKIDTDDRGAKPEAVKSPKPSVKSTTSQNGKIALRRYFKGSRKS